MWDYIADTVKKIIFNYSSLLFHYLPNSLDVVSIYGDQVFTFNLLYKTEETCFQERDQIISSVLESDKLHILINTTSPNSLKLWNYSNG